ncbi:MAG: type III secretion system export apparatus subunit SctV [Deltaproteobacteria bacterium]|nr:type III secretion system export apparatus subunit SctV [Deltaproteobacteria bacterium]
MRLVKPTLSALPIASIGRHPDLLLATFVAGLVAMLIIPMPAALLDLLLAANLASAVLILVLTLLARTALSVSTFPSLLLITTLFRLGLNVSTTRMILTKGDAGEVVRAFGEFVVQGDLIVGLVIFLVITLVQFMVVGKGAERVAEVAARFTLDAMPGKQMAIDAAVRSGAIPEEEGQRRRDELARESQLFGAMDGAMKFVKGDAIAGLVITALNLVAGFLIGVLRHGFSVAEAAQLYSILTVGDALVAQIPALLITLSAGVLTTRVNPREQRHGLGDSMKLELLASPKVPGLAGALALGIALVPGMPAIPFVMIGLGLLGLSRSLVTRARRDAQQERASEAGKRAAFERKLAEKVKEAKARRSLADHVAPAAQPISIDLDPALTEALSTNQSAEGESVLTAETLVRLRELIYGQLGVRIPPVLVRGAVAHGLPGSFTICIKEVPIEEHTIPVDRLLAVESAARLARLGVRGQTAKHPLGGAEATWVAKADRVILEAAGVQVRTTEEVIALTLFRVVRRHAKDLLGLQEVSDMVDRLEKAYPALVKEVVPKLLSLSQLADVLRRLVEEHISIRDLKTIVEALADCSSRESDAVTLTEAVRAALAMQIAHQYAGRAKRLSVLQVDPLIEDTVRGALQPLRGGYVLALEPEIRSAIIESTRRALLPAHEAGVPAVILTSAAVRPYFRALVEQDLPEVAVLSYQELPAQLLLQSVGRVVIREALAA